MTQQEAMQMVQMLMQQGSNPASMYMPPWANGSMPPSPAMYSNYGIQNPYPTFPSNLPGGPIVNTLAGMGIMAGETHRRGPFVGGAGIFDIGEQFLGKAQARNINQAVLSAGKDYSVGRMEQIVTNIQTALYGVGTPEFERAQLNKHNIATHLSAQLTSGPGASAIMSALAANGVLGYVAPELAINRGAFMGMMGMAGVGALGPSSSLTAEITKEVLSRNKLNADNFSTNFKYTRGFSVDEQSQLMSMMGNRNMLLTGDDQYKISNAGKGGDAAASKLAADNLGNMLKAMEQMRYIFGDQGLPKLFNELNSILGGAAHSVSSAKLSAIGQNIREISRATGMDPAAVSGFVGQYTTMARQQGLSVEAGLSVMNAMGQGQAVASMQGTYAGSLNQAETINVLARQQYTAQQSRAAARYGAISYLVKQQAELRGATVDEHSRLSDLSAAMGMTHASAFFKAWENKDTAAITDLSRGRNLVQLEYELHRTTGQDLSTIHDFMNTITARTSQEAAGPMGEMSSKLNQQDIINKLTLGVTGRRAAAFAGIKGNDGAAVFRAVIAAGFAEGTDDSTKGLSAAAIKNRQVRAAMAFTGGDSDAAEALVAKVNNSADVTMARAGIGPNPTAGTQGAFSILGDAAINEAKTKMLAQKEVSNISEVLSGTGIGKQGIIARLFESMMVTGSNSGALSTALKVIGGLANVKDIEGMQRDFSEKFTEIKEAHSARKEALLSYHKALKADDPKAAAAAMMKINEAEDKMRSANTKLADKWGATTAGISTELMNIDFSDKEVQKEVATAEKSGDKGLKDYGKTLVNKLNEAKKALGKTETEGKGSNQFDVKGTVTLIGTTGNANTNVLSKWETAALVDFKLGQ